MDLRDDWVSSGSSWKPVAGRIGVVGGRVVNGGRTISAHLQGEKTARTVFTGRMYNRVNLHLRVVVEPDFNHVTGVPVVVIGSKWLM